MFCMFFQEQEENKGATSWPEYYIDQLNSMAAVSTSQQSQNVAFSACSAVFPALCLETQNVFTLRVWSTEYETFVSPYSGVRS